MIRDLDTSTVEHVVRAIDDDQVIRFAQELVRINSINPNLAPGSSEEKVAGLIAETCQKAGLQVSYREVAPGRPNLVCVLPGKTPEIGLVFLGHTDTVPVLGMENPHSGEISGNYLWGRGSVDMKGGLAAAVQATLALARTDVELLKGVAVAAVIDEESEHRGAYALAQEGFESDYCIVPEPSDNRILLGCKGTAPIHIDFTGVLAHGSNPWLGVNAIEQAAKVVSVLSAMKFKELEIPELRTVIRGTMNIGVIQGGTQYNNVADKCDLFLDRRMIPGETQESCLTEIRNLLDQFAAEDPQFKAEARISRPDWHWEPIKQRGLNPAYTPATSLVARALESAHRQVYDQQVSFGYTNGYLDMDFMVNSLKIPSINYGPGEPGEAHTPHERLRLDQLIAATRVYALAALQLAS
ncbi:MAG: ArgE/DapE family deacylase [Chloroflexi bacterium]|nr:ArgE/DapE family deacylase [Chloroflexota bacterium]